MKHSIKKIFKNLIVFLSIITITLGLITFFVIQQHMSYTKVNNLKEQKKIINSLTSLRKSDLELALIEFNAKSNQLHYNINQLRKLDKYNYIDKLILSNSNEYLSDLNELEKLTNNFNKSAQDYYVKNKENEDIKKENFQKKFILINKFLDAMMLKNISYEEEKFYIFEKIIFFAFIVSLFTLFWYRKRFGFIYNDLVNLYATDKQNVEIFSQEADAIQLRMKKKPVDDVSPMMLDPVTQIKNYHGMINSYANKKGIKDSNFTSVTIFEIDNFSKKKRTFSQEFTQNILKKIAFTISLHEQATDVIARTDYNQFTVILSRASKEQLFKDMDIIRQSISEIKFKEPGGKQIAVTVTGGYMVKPLNQHIEEALKIAKEILNEAKKSGNNFIGKIKGTNKLI